MWNAKREALDDRPRGTQVKVSGATIGRTAIWVLFLVTLSFRLFIADRGYEITDEGLALVAARHPEDVKMFPSAFAWPTHLMLEASGGTVAGFRRVGIVVLVSAAWALAFGARRLDPRTSAFDLLPRAGLGALVFYSPGLSTPAYNLVASAGMLISVGLTLAATSCPETRSSCLLAAFGSGAGLGLAGLAKPPGGAALGLLEALVFFAAGAARRRLIVPWLLGGALVTGLQCAAQGTDELARMLTLGLEYTRRLQGGHEPDAILGRLAGGSWPLLVGALVPLGGAFAAHRVWRGIGSRAPRLRPFSATASALALLGIVAVRGGLLGGHRAAVDGSTTSALLAAAALALAMSFVGSGAPSPPRTSSLALLAVSPVLMTLGTNTPLAFSLLFFVAPWFLLPEAAHGLRPGDPSGLVLLLLAAAASITAPFVSPYRWASSLREQNVPITLGAPPSRIKVDRETAQFIRAWRGSAQRCGLTPDTPVLGLTWVPGLVFAVGGRAPVVTHFVSDRWGGASATNNLALALIEPADLASAYVIQTTTGLRLAPRLNLGARSFPDDYEVCFDGELPYRQREGVRLFRPLPLGARRAGDLL